MPWCLLFSCCCTAASGSYTHQSAMSLLALALHRYTVYIMMMVSFSDLLLRLVVPLHNLLHSCNWLQACTSLLPILILTPPPWSRPSTLILVPCSDWMLACNLTAILLPPVFTREKIAISSQDPQLVYNLTMHNCWGKFSLGSYGHASCSPSSSPH
jgi:hypothetical protein